MSIGAISPISAVGLPTPVAGVGASNASSGTDFAAALGSNLQNLQNVQDKADGLAVQAATGSLTDVHEYMIAATEANLTTQLTVAVRNKALDAFNEIMRMQA
jgi:flagellar hook-basal body complex protein FliE